VAGSVLPDFAESASVGYLTILLLTTLPWLVTLLVGFRALNEERDWAYYILHTILTAMVAGWC